MNPTNPDPVLDVNRHALLEEGARSYLEALTALTIFRKDVQSVCRQAIVDRVTEFSQALGVPMFKAESIVPYATPEDQFNGSSAYIGVKHKISRRRQSIHGFSSVSTCGLSWEPMGQQRWFGCWVGVGFNQREIAERLHAGFQRSKESLPPGIALDAQKNNVSVSRALKPDDMASLTDCLGEVMVEWIRLWREFGGLKALAPEQT